MKILMVIGQFYPFIGGAERQCLKLCKALRNRGHEVKVLTVWQSRELPQTEIIDGIPVERVWYPMIRLQNRKLAGFGFLSWVIMAYHVFRNLKYYDVIHVHQGLWPAFSALLAAIWCRKPVVCKIGNSGKRFDLLQLRRKHLYGPYAVRLMKKNMCKFIWTSSAVHEDLNSMKIAARQLVYIPNGVELGKEKKVKKDDSVTGFIYMGSLIAKKNIFLLIEAVKLLSSSYKEKLSMAIAGDGSEKQRLADFIRKCEVERYVHLQGAVNKVEELFCNNNVFVLASFTEGLSNAALEAMACGLPLILSYAGGNIDLIETENDVMSQVEKEDFAIGTNGIFINHTKAESLAGAMKYMMDNPKKREEMGRRSLEIAEARYSIERVAVQYEYLYEECVNAARCAS